MPTCGAPIWAYDAPCRRRLHRYGHVRVLRDFSLGVDVGEVVGLLAATARARPRHSRRSWAWSGQSAAALCSTVPATGIAAHRVGARHGMPAARVAACSVT